MISFAVFGLKINVSVAFAGVTALMCYIDKTGLMFYVMTAVLLHEAGHIVAMYLIKIPPDAVTLKIGAAEIEGVTENGTQKHFIIAAAGPVINILGMAVCFMAYRLFGNLSFALNFNIMFVFALLNLLPILGLDGGDLLFCLLVRKISIKKSRRILIFFSIFNCFIIMAFGIYLFFKENNNPSLMLLALYLFCNLRKSPEFKLSVYKK